MSKKKCYDKDYMYTDHCGDLEFCDVDTGKCIKNPDPENFWFNLPEYKYTMVGSKKGLGKWSTEMEKEGRYDDFDVSFKKISKQKPKRQKPSPVAKKSSSSRSPSPKKVSPTKRKLHKKSSPKKRKPSPQKKVKRSSSKSPSPKKKKSSSSRSPSRSSSPSSKRCYDEDSDGCEDEYCNIDTGDCETEPIKPVQVYFDLDGDKYFGSKKGLKALKKSDKKFSKKRLDKKAKTLFIDERGFIIRDEVRKSPKVKASKTKKSPKTKASKAKPSKPKAPKKTPSPSHSDDEGENVELEFEGLEKESDKDIEKINKIVKKYNEDAKKIKKTQKAELKKVYEGVSNKNKDVSEKTKQEYEKLVKEFKECLGVL